VEVCTREYRHKGRVFSAALDAPIQVAPLEWHCPVRVGEIRERAVGIDAMQALQLGLQLCRNLLDQHFPFAVWTTTDEVSSGIPQVIVNPFGTAFDGHFERVVELEIERVSATLAMLNCRGTRAT
jgi:hypothetical protein